MQILVIGGTGFLGYYAIRELLARGHTVTAVALPPLPAANLLPPEVRLTLADLNALPDADVRELVRGHTGVVYAAGADDRSTPPAPAYQFFYAANVAATARFFRLARESGAQRGVLLSSYFATFDRLWPELELRRHHPYIWSRCAQAEQALSAAGSDLELMILELGYIFGSMPGRKPLWAPLIHYLRSPWPLLYPRGGTTMIAVERVAEAIAGALERGGGGTRYPIGGENLTWAAWLERLARLVGKPRRVITLPTGLLRAGARLLKAWHARQGREAGLDPVRFVDVQTRETYLDAAPARAALGYGLGGLEEAFAATVKAS